MRVFKIFDIQTILFSQELDQDPKSKDELVASYGYDIRNFIHKQYIFLTQIWFSKGNLN